MKQTLLLLSFLFSGLFFHATGQTVFGVSPGLGLNSAYGGILIGENLIPYFSFQYIGAQYTYEEPDYKDEFTGNLFVPTLGIKWYIGGSGKIRSYMNLAVSKPFISGAIKYDGEVDEEFDDIVNEISLIGMELGFGVEYFLDDHFSVNGEYGLRYLRGKFEVSDEFDDFKVKASLTPTFSKVGVNFYFSRKEE